nr:MAG TPA: hypothetical protein [Caudoviricetes sp.]
MLTLRESFKRKKLFEELDEKWKTVELVLLGKKTYINRWNFKPNYYLIIEEAEVGYSGDVYHLIITLDPTEPTNNENALSPKARRLGFTNWWIGTKDLQKMRQSLKPLVPILYTNEENLEF